MIWPLWIIKAYWAYVHPSAAHYFLFGVFSLLLIQMNDRLNHYFPKEIKTSISDKRHEVLGGCDSLAFSSRDRAVFFCFMTYWLNFKDVKKICHSNLGCKLAVVHLSSHFLLSKNKFASLQKLNMSINTRLDSCYCTYIWEWQQMGGGVQMESWK